MDQMDHSSDVKGALVVGAGSIGAHLARSLTKAGWSVQVIDTSAEAVARFVNQLYPGRYGELPEKLSVSLSSDLDPSRIFDAMVVGTPPDTHLSVLRAYTERVTRIVSVQKPLTTFRMSEIRELEKIEATSNAIFLAGFNHRVSLGALAFWSLIPGLFYRQTVTIEVDWLESWDGIMKAHPWLASPAETYLGYTSRGGGALFEHSHGLDLGLMAADILGLGKLREISSQAKVVTEGEMSYDQESKVTAKYANGSKLISHQDVTTWPAKKSMTISSPDWTATLEAGTPETVSIRSAKGQLQFQASFAKTREEDFDAEVRQFELLLSGKNAESSLSRLSHGLLTAKISSIVASQALGMHQDVYTERDLIDEGLFNEEVF